MHEAIKQLVKCLFFNVSIPKKNYISQLSWLVKILVDSVRCHSVRAVDVDVRFNILKLLKSIQLCN